MARELAMRDGEEIVIETAERILSRVADPQTINQQDDGWQHKAWEELSRSGLTTVCASEATGGGGGSLGVAFELMRVAGRVALALPLAESLLGSWLLSQVGRELPCDRLTVAPAHPRDRISMSNRRLNG